MLTFPVTFFGGGAAPLIPAVDSSDVATSTSPGTSATMAVDVGTGFLIVCVVAREASFTGADPSSVTIGGHTASKIQVTTGTASQSAIYYYDNTGGTISGTVNVVATWANSHDTFSCHVFTVSGVNSSAQIGQSLEDEAGAAGEVSVPVAPDSSDSLYVAVSSLAANALSSGPSSDLTRAHHAKVGDAITGHETWSGTGNPADITGDLNVKWSQGSQKTLTVIELKAG